MSTKVALKWVLQHMPKESADALITFTLVNPHWQGAGWDDCLDALLDSDSHLEVTEPLYEDDELRNMGTLPAAVAITLMWANAKTFAKLPEQQALMVKATIVNNGGVTA